LSEPFEAITVAEFTREFSSNVLGPILTLQGAIREFGFEGSRVIIAGSNSMPNAALRALTPALRTFRFCPGEQI
jgi:3-oxoacyl-[acyl-carrier protein] reductase